MKTMRVVFLVCSGLGRINRGYESFARECFSALKETPEFDLYLFKGGGKRLKREIVLPNLHRKNRSTQWLGKLLNKETYLLEQASFCLSLLPYILIKKPVVIYYSDFMVGTCLWHLRNMLNLKYKLLFSNGAPVDAPFKRKDHIQQLLPVYIEAAVAKGEPSTKQTLLPYGFDINIEERLTALHQRKDLRQKMCIPSDAKVILSIGAVNRYQKRMDYVVDEFALLPNNYFLVILGQFDDETWEIKALAESKIPGRYLISSVSFEEVSKFYIIADYFMLGSLQEGFGRVLIEALSHGLPCIVHDYVNARQVLGENGHYIDMRKKGSLLKLFENASILTDKEILIRKAYEAYSWDKLRPRYVSMITNLSETK